MSMPPPAADSFTVSAEQEGRTLSALLRARLPGRSWKAVRRLIETHPGFYPLYTHEGRWKHDQPAWTRWCDGFLPGMMWLFLGSGLADDPSYWRKKAEEYSSRLEERKEDRDVHDLGFIFYHGTYKRWYEATVREGQPDQRLKDVVIRAGQVLAMRFKQKGQYLRSFISDDGIRCISDTFSEWKEAGKYSRIVRCEEIQKNDFNISPSRYIDTGNADEYRPIADIVAELDILEDEAALTRKALKAILAQIQT